MAQQGNGSRASAWLLGLAIVVALPGVVTLVLGAFPALQPAGVPLVLLASFIPLGIVSWLLAACLAIAAVMADRARPVTWILALLALAGLAVQSAWLAPHLVPERERAEGASFTVTSLNVELGIADRDVPDILALASAVDVLVLLEVTPASLALLHSRGITAHLPYWVGEGASGADGTIVFARSPLTEYANIPTRLESRVVQVSLPSGPVTVAAVHPAYPLASGDGWSRDGAVVRDGVRPYLGSPLVVAGDFNAIDRHWTMRELEALGLRSAADLAGAGWQPTWPSGTGIPPFAAIDHVLVSRALTATAFSTAAVSGSDHRAVTARLDRVARPDW